MIAHIRDPEIVSDTKMSHSADNVVPRPVQHERKIIPLPISFSPLLFFFFAKAKRGSFPPRVIGALRVGYSYVPRGVRTSVRAFPRSPFIHSEREYKYYLRLRVRTRTHAHVRAHERDT